MGSVTRPVRPIVTAGAIGKARVALLRQRALQGSPAQAGACLKRADMPPIAVFEDGILVPYGVSVPGSLPYSRSQRERPAMRAVSVSA